MSANHRVLDVDAYTTLDFVEASACGSGWQDDRPAVLDVGVPEDAPEAVVLELELDPTACDRVKPHADCVTLTGEQARTLGESLLEAADDDGGDCGGRRRGR